MDSETKNHEAGFLCVCFVCVCVCVCFSCLTSMATSDGFFSGAAVITNVKILLHFGGGATGMGGVGGGGGSNKASREV